MPYLLANWKAPSHIGALTTTRRAGFSMGPYASNNIGLHVEDNPVHVQANRDKLVDALQLPQEPYWLEQVHGNECLLAEEASTCRADAIITKCHDRPLAIMTADCLPILLCNDKGTEIGAIHAGWRGLANGIVENTIHKMTSHAHEVLAWIGPGICQACFEIGEDVRDAFLLRYAFTESAFIRQNTRWSADLPKLAELILNHAGVGRVSQSSCCTYELEEQFYSYRREKKTGRMATLIWFK